MGYDNEHTEILDIFEDISYVEPPKELQQQDLQKEEIKEITNEKNKKISIPIMLLPIFILMYIISTNSMELINERISVFSLIMIGILTIILIIGFIKESKLRRKISFRIISFSKAIIYIGIFVLVSFMLYGNESKIKYFLVEKAMSTTNHQYLATWFYDEGTIAEVLNRLKESTIVDMTGSNKLNFSEVKEEDTMYANAYEEEILTNKNATYKKIIIKGKNYQGFFLVIYNLDLLNLNTNEMIIPEEIPIENPKNVLGVQDGKLANLENTLDNNYIEYKTNINKFDQYQNEIIIGQRKDNIVMILVIEENQNLIYADIMNLFKNYGVETSISVNNNYQLQLDTNNIVITNEK